MTGATTLADAIAAVPIIATGTVFGTSLLARAVLLGVTVSLVWTARPVARVAALGLGGLALAPQARMGHAAAEAWPFQLALALHVIAAAA